MSQIAATSQEGSTTPLGKSKGKQNILANSSSAEKGYKELAKRNLNVDSSARFSLSNADENDLSHSKLSFMEELGNREEEIRKMLHESKPTKHRDAFQDKTNKRNVYAELARQDSDDEECTFKPKINANTNKLLKRQTTDQPINEVLYKSAFDKKVKEKEAVAEVQQKLSKDANANKINMNSMKIVFKRIETALRSLIHEIEDPNRPESLTFEALGVLLQRLGVFRNLEFSQTEESNQRSSVSTKGKPQILAKEIAFHENLWKILVCAADNQYYISSEIVLRFLMILLEDKTSVADAATFLQEIMSIGLEEKGITKEENISAFDKIKNENNLWDLEKLVTEFRKLFNDKTTFMNIYSKAGSLPRNTVDDKQNFRPQINPKSKEILDMKTKKNAGNQELGSPDKLKNKFDVLFEHHKYVKEKQNENLETRIEQELANCTFKPQITEYKKKGKSGSHSAYLDQDISKAKRHDLLYGVARIQKEKLTQKAYEAKKSEENKELSECTFQPRINTNSEDSLFKEQSVIQGPPPKGYKKAIERMKVAEKIREVKKAEKEYIPRGENYEKLRNADFKPPSFLNRPKSKKNEALVYVDVNIGPGKTGRIGLHRGDDAKTLAKNFARTYSLPPVMKDSLEKLLQTYIDSYFPDKEENQDGSGEEHGDQVPEEEHEEDDDDEEENQQDYELEKEVDRRQEQQMQQNQQKKELKQTNEEEEDDEEDDDDEEDIDLNQSFGEDDEEDDDDDDEDFDVQVKKGK